jgi:hypothetical protein
MGLKTAIGKSVKSALKTVGDLAETITYNSRTDGVYTVATGAVAHTTVTHSLKAVISYLGGATDSNDNSKDFTGDLSALFASDDLSVSPDTNDTITRGSETYAINNISSDPANASYTLILTRVG